MLLRTIIAVAGVSLLSACTIFSWGEDNPENRGSDEDAAPRAVQLEVPPDLTRPATSPQFAVPPAKGASTGNTAAAATPGATPAAVGSTTAPTDGRDVEARLRELQALRDKGLIDDKELQERRKAVLESL